MVQGFVRQGFWPRRAEATLGTAAKQTVVLGRHPLASGVEVISTAGVALAYFFAARLSLALLEPVDGVAVFWPAAGVASEARRSASNHRERLISLNCQATAAPDRHYRHDP